MHRVSGEMMHEATGDDGRGYMVRPQDPVRGVMFSHERMAGWVSCGGLAVVSRRSIVIGTHAMAGRILLAAHGELMFARAPWPREMGEGNPNKYPNRRG